MHVQDVLNIYIYFFMNIYINFQYFIKQQYLHHMNWGQNQLENEEQFRYKQYLSMTTTHVYCAGGRLFLVPNSASRLAGRPAFPRSRAFRPRTPICPDLRHRECC